MNKLGFFRNFFKKEISFRKYSQDAISTLSVEYSNGVKTITLNDKKTRNALSINMMENLINNIRSNNSDPFLRVIVLAANGNVFSAGHNLKELSSLAGTDTHQKVFTVAADLMNAIIDSPVPIIAKVNGIAAAAGCQLVAQCDLAICSENSTFLTPGVNFGIFCSTPGVALSRSLPKSTTMKMLLTGKSISANEAKDAGLVVEVCQENKLDISVNEYCEDIKMKSRQVVELGKRFYYEQINLNLKDAYHKGGNTMVENLQLQDGKEGIDSFIEKRRAIWTHGKK
ncbi:hypothetical protein WA026_000511 [Henosepilachna vigintioctopunctata]|uniref:Enoyl-CoA hydratase domain-containing protein 3, mitochondrial n=1 Tax=Henosepilachna vigintioctopunctata TaxID=420089 RepID=A0AAW1V5D9_9CUCU